jgi:homoaconitase/3-isopropylmalate dehydratase large subunit
MAGEPFYLQAPRVVRIHLTGRLQAWVTAKDIILHILELLTTKGNVGIVLEYGGPGIAGLTVPERATIANMGAECGVTTSIFPSDDMTRRFLEAQSRGGDWIPLEADAGSSYAGTVEIDLGRIEPLAACPHSPDNIRRIRDIGPIAVNQVCIGSCTNSSYKDLATVAKILKGQTVHPDVSFVLAPAPARYWNRSPGKVILRTSSPPAPASWRTPADSASATAKVPRHSPSPCAPPIGISTAAPEQGMPTSIWSVRKQRRQPSSLGKSRTPGTSTCPAPT